MLMCNQINIVIVLYHVLCSSQSIVLYLL